MQAVSQPGGWDQGSYWTFETLEAVKEVGLNRWEGVHLLWSRDCRGTGYPTKWKLKCLSCALAMGAKRAPKLNRDADLPQQARTLQMNLGEGALRVGAPMQLGAAVQYKTAVGRDAFKKITRCGHVCVFRGNWGRDIGSLGAYLQEVKVQVASETGYLYRTPWEAYAHKLEDQQWAGITGNPDLNDETSGGLLEFVLAFTGLAPCYRKSFARWGFEPIVEAMRHFSQEAARVFIYGCRDRGDAEGRRKPHRRRGRVGGPQQGADPAEACGCTDGVGSRRGREPRVADAAQSSGRPVARPYWPGGRGAPTLGRQLRRPNPWDAIGVPGTGMWEDPFPERSRDAVGPAEKPDGRGEPGATGLGKPALKPRGCRDGRDPRGSRGD